MALSDINLGGDKKLIYRRAGFKGVVTKLEGELETFIATATLTQLRAKAESLQNTRDTILALDEKIIETLSDPNDIQRECFESTLVNESILNILGRLKEAINSLDSSSGTKEGDSNKRKDPKHVVNLPKLNLPRFGGDLTDWLSFWEVFESTVGNSDLDDVRKFYYLKGQLEGEALQLIEGFSSTGESYKEVVDLLKNTYGNEEQLKVAHVLALLNLKEPHLDTEQLSKFRAKVECHTRSLDTLGLTIDEAIVIILRQKLPMTILDKVRTFELDEFKKLLNREIVTMQLNKNKSVTKGEVRGGTMNMAVGLPAKKGEKKPQITCKLCSGKHKWFSCLKFQTNEARIARAKQLNLCSSCLGSDHAKGGACTATYLRPCRYCNGHHYDKLCSAQKRNAKVTPETSTTLNLNTKRDATILPTVQVPMEGLNGKVTCRALVDQGSQRSFVHEDSLEYLRYTVVGTENLQLQGFTGVNSRQDYKIVRLSYFYRRHKEYLECIVVNTLPEYQTVSGAGGVERVLRKKGIKLSDPARGQSKVDILIGVDFYYNIVFSGFKNICGVMLLPTKFGYCLSGRIKALPTNTLVDTVSVLRLNETYEERLIGVATHNDPKQNTVFDLESMWKLDHLGIQSQEINQDSKLALAQFDQSVMYSEENQQYIVRLPWRNLSVDLPDNYGLALGRLISLRKKLLMDPKICRAYDQIFQTYLERGFIEEVPPYNNTSGIIHYLAHHGVEKDSATTPIRVVFDCSAKSSHTLSLNDCLLTGPSLVSDLTQQLLRFRVGQYAFTSDIEKAFLMVGLHEVDRDATRFLWYRDINDPSSPIVVYRFRVVLFGATCSPFLLNATIRRHLETSDENTVGLSRGLYIDNLQGTDDSQVGLVKTYEQARRLFSKAHLYLREWVTNSDSLKECLDRDDVAASDQDSSKNLGMLWLPKTDVLTYPSKSFNEGQTHTKRSILSKLSKVFDPMGLLLPVTIRARIFMQEIWRRNIDWDCQLPSDLQDQALTLLKDYDIFSSIQVPRHIVSFNECVTIHAFCDASATAYGAAIYFVAVNASHLVTARAKVAPVKMLTIPKLELTAMLLLARLVIYVREAFMTELSFDSIHVWSDSQIALSWVFSDKSLPVYVRNRVDEIRSLIPDAVYHYIPTKDNPSDMLTRGISALHLQKSGLWWSGPTWLLSQKDWPSPWVPGGGEAPALETVTLAPLPQKLPDYIEWARFGSYNKTVRVVAWMLRFLANIRKRRTGELCNMGQNIDASEFRAAEKTLIELVQKETFAHEYESMKSSNKPKPNLVRQLKLYLDCGLIRCEGRLKWSEVDVNAQNPILMPNKHPVTDLLVMRIHQEGTHFGIHYTVSKLRLKWWIPKVRQVVRRIIKKCVICRKLKGMPFKTGPAPPLPDFRVHQVEPFQIVGLDYTGALRVREEEDKVYILLFTCATSRAVHLELCDNMSCEEFLLAFRRFCARKSFPQLMVSDNAPTFHQASNYLKELQEDPNVISFLGEKGCKWRFIPTSAPWFGGMWERCVGIIKSGLRAVIGRALLRKTELVTVLTEVEASVNDRPLTYVYTDLQEPLPLTPAHLLYGKPLTAFPPEVELDQDSTMYSKETVTRRYKYITTIIQNFRKRWLNDYLLALRERSAKNGTNVTAPLEGDIVLIKDERPRLYWRMGRVLKIYKGDDSVERVALLKTSTGTTVRPIARLYPLELHFDNGEFNAGPEKQEIPDKSQVDVDDVQPQVGTRTRRAAQAAIDMWRSKLSTGEL